MDMSDIGQKGGRCVGFGQACATARGLGIKVWTCAKGAVVAQTESDAFGFGTGVWTPGTPPPKTRNEAKVQEVGDSSPEILNIVF